jgi:hypothetical protein
VVRCGRSLGRAVMRRDEQDHGARHHFPPRPWRHRRRDVAPIPRHASAVGPAVGPSGCRAGPSSSRPAPGTGARASDPRLRVRAGAAREVNRAGKRPAVAGWSPSPSEGLGGRLDVSIIGDQRAWRQRKLAPASRAGAPKPLAPHARRPAADPGVGLPRRARVRFGWCGPLGRVCLRMAVRPADTSWSPDDGGDPEPDRRAARPRRSFRASRGRSAATSAAELASGTTRRAAGRWRHH